MRGRGRPIEEAPEGMVTIRQAIELTGLGYGVIYRRVVAETVRYKQSENKTVFIDVRDLPILMEKRIRKQGVPSVAQVEISSERSPDS